MPPIGAEKIKTLRCVSLGVFFLFPLCNSLKKVNISSGITEIEDRTFYGCSALENLSIPEGKSILIGLLLKAVMIF